LGISRFRRTSLVIIPPPRLTYRRYVNKILELHVLPIRNRVGNRFILMQDKVRPHIANFTRQFLRKQSLSFALNCSLESFSPDLNPIEHLGYGWTELQQNYPQLANLRELAQAFGEIWRRLPQVAIRRCINMQ